MELIWKAIKRYRLSFRKKNFISTSNRSYIIYTYILPKEHFPFLTEKSFYPCGVKKKCVRLKSFSASILYSINISYPFHSRQITLFHMEFSQSILKSLAYVSYSFREDTELYICWDAANMWTILSL